MPATGDKVMNKTDANSGLQEEVCLGREALRRTRKTGGSVSVPSGGCCGFEYSQEGFPKKWAFKQIYNSNKYNRIIPITQK